MTTDSLAVLITGVTLDAVTSTAFLAGAAAAHRHHEGPERQRVISSATFAGLVMGAAVVLRVAAGPVLPAWYVPVYALGYAAIVYAAVVHMRDLRRQFQATRARVDAVTAELDQADSDPAGAPTGQVAVPDERL